VKEDFYEKKFYAEDRDSEVTMTLLFTVTESSFFKVATASFALSKFSTFYSSFIQKFAMIIG